MDKFSFLIASFKRRENASLKWLLTVLAYTEDTNPPPYHPVYTDGKVMAYDEEGNVVLDTKVGKHQALFTVNDKFTIKKGDLPNVSKDTVTTVGIALINANCLCDRLGDAIPYQNGVLSDKKESQLIAEAVKDKRITIEQSTLAIRNRHWMTGILQTVLPSASMKSLVPNKDIRKVRDERLKADPSIITDTTKAVELEDELIQMDKDYIKGDPSEAFYKSKKAFTVTRKRMFGTFGLEKEPGGKGMRLLTGSLQEGITVDDAPYVFNSLRDGSYSRGAETQLGGEIVKFLLRIFEKTVISMDDCGTKHGLSVPIDSISLPNLVTRFYIEGGKVKELTDEVLKKNIGKTLVIRSPFACNAPNGHFCGTCMGSGVTHNKKALSMLAVEVGSAFVTLFLAKMHGTAYNLEEYDFTKHIR